MSGTTGYVSAEWPTGYATSHTNYVNVALMDICFQLFAEVKDVDELLEMVRSTALTDYIRLDSQIQPLQLINPAGFIQKYLMVSELPSLIGNDETSILEKGYYKGVAFDIPGAEVKIGEEWIPATEDNSEIIKASKPFNAEWRLNGTLLRKIGYKPGDTIEGRMFLVDDQWNGLRLEIPVNVIVK